MKIRTILALVAIMLSLNAMSQAFTLTGVVTDSITGDELGYATVAIKGTSLGTTTDEKGNFSITVPHYDCHLTVTYMGYKPIDCEITSATPRHLRLAMTPSEYTLKEVVIKKHHEKYSKKNNPAVELIKNMIAHRDAGDTEGLYELPGGCYRMGKAPYMEASAGIENIFKFLRIDYVWRLNYRHHAGIQKRGVRMTFHFTF